MLKKIVFPKFVKKWCSKSRYIRFWIFVFKKCNFTILQKLSTLFFKLTLCMEKNEFFFVFFHSFSPWLTSRNFTFFNHFYHTSEWHPPHSVAEKTSKSVKILPIGFSTKTRKSVITRRKWFFQNFRKKCTYGDFDENFQKFAGCLGVKNWQKLPKK